MGLFSCCSSKSVAIEESTVIEERKVTSATSKESKDSGCPSDLGIESVVSIASDVSLNHKGDGDHETTKSIVIEESFVDDDEAATTTDAAIITEDSSSELIESVSDRPVTPKLCLTGVAVTNESVKKVQTQSVLDELTASNAIFDPVQTSSGAVAYTFGAGVGLGGVKPARLPPLKPRRKQANKKTIDHNGGLKYFFTLFYGSFEEKSDTYTPRCAISPNLEKVIFF